MPIEIPPSADIDLSDSQQESSVALHQDRNVTSILAGVVGASLLLGSMLYLMADEAQGGFVNVHAMLWVLIAPPALLFSIYGWAGVVDAFTYIARPPAPGKTADDAVTLFRLWAAFALASGFVATLAGIVVMLTALDDASRLGQKMAIVLLSQLYGVFAAVICVSIAAIIARRHNGAESTMPLAREAAGVAGITVIAGTLTVLVAFGILMLAHPLAG